MADGKRQEPSKTAECERARAALAQGDHRGARTLAQAVLDDAAASDAAKAEAREIERATRVDRGALVTGAIILAVLIALFVFVFRQSH